MMLLPCLTLAFLCVAQAWPSGWKGTPQEIRTMEMCGKEIFDINGVNMESVKMKCVNETGFDPMKFWYMLMGKGKHGHHKKGRRISETKGEPWPEMEPYSEEEPYPEDEPYPEGEPESDWEGSSEEDSHDCWMKMCDFGDSEEETSSEETSSEEFFDMDEDVETMEPEKMMEKMGKMKKKMMKMKCMMMVMMMKKMKMKHMKKKDITFSAVKQMVDRMPSKVQEMHSNFESCIGTNMGFMDADNNILGNALRIRIEGLEVDNEIIKEKLLDKMDACIAHEKPQLFYMCLKMDCKMYQKMFGKKYKCVEQ